jgi:hypothetical protein
MTEVQDSSYTIILVGRRMKVRALDIAWYIALKMNVSMVWAMIDIKVNMATMWHGYPLQVLPRLSGFSKSEASEMGGG